MTERDFIKGFLDGLRPEPRMTVWEWADRFRILPATSSAEPGRWRTARTPYLREILEKLSTHDPTQTVVVKKGAQVGLTEAGNNWLGYVIATSPGAFLYVMPTVDTVERNSKLRIDPMFESTPILREKVKPARSRNSHNTTFQKEFPGGVLVLTGANSAVGLRSMPARYLMLDEVDGYPLDLDGEGNPVDLARARTRTFPRKKIFMISTPTVEGQSLIDAEFQRTDQRQYQVPCPDCGTLQVLKFEQIKYALKESGKVDPATVFYCCEHCAAEFDERQKPRILAAGQWIAAEPKNADTLKVGYHLSSLYSPLGWYSWADAVQDFLDAAGNVTKLKVFTNTVLGECWAEATERIDWKRLQTAAGNYLRNRPPKNVCLLTAGVDVQKDRLEVEICGWAKGLRSYSVDYRIFYGDTSEPGVWEQLAGLFAESWQRDDGVLLRVSKMCVDSGFNTSQVYAFCRKIPGSLALPVKGQEKQIVVISPPRAVDRTQKGKAIGQTRVWNVGVGILKSELLGWLQIDGDAPGACSFPAGYDEKYFRGLVSERLETKTDKRGFQVQEWKKIYERNEPLDCRVYARAAAAILGVDVWKDEHFDALATSLGETKNQNKTKKARSDFW